MNNRDAVLTTAAELRRQIGEDAPPAILDVRWRLDRPDGRPDYEAGHIPGAVYVSLEDDLSDHSRTGLGRHPLPTGAAVQAAARRWGLRQGSPVVVYDDWNRAGSSRAWWVITAAGIPGVRILDGGLAAWTAAGGELQTGPVTPAPGDITVAHDDLYAGGRPTLTADQVGAASVATLLDARAPERFRGEVEPVDAVAGHIPGARNLPSMTVLDAGGSFLPQDALASLLHGVDSEDGVGVYCGSGVTASVVLAALRSAGVEAALFPGSWSQWSAAGRPAAQGS
ncbi:sulfurtransferase [Mycolicibacterium sp.]|uniref:sulfurtransferase n=1 Tax=Mycolicibacterium sp. TaxID=2320850 RepID=UPI0037CA7B41